MEPTYARPSFLANIWSNRYHIFDKCLMDIFDMECAMSYINTESMRIFNCTPEQIYNAFTYDTYYGNLGHGVCEKVKEMLKNGFIKECYPYFYLLFVARYNHNLNLLAVDGWDETPYNTVQYGLPGLPEQTSMRILQKLVNPSYCIVTVAQSFVRRWLAIRRVQKLKFRMVLDHILTSPSCQIEFNNFPSFPGGQLYIKASQDFHISSVDELTNLLINY